MIKMLHSAVLRRRLILFIILWEFQISLAFPQQTSDSVRLKHVFNSRAADAIVPVGYGTQKKLEVIGSISSVKSSEFNQGFMNNPEQLIQGKVAGLSLSKPGGNPNEGYYMRLRGLSTINAISQPLIVIDGVTAASLENLDPTDIESITVLKDGMSSAIYGISGSNGVLLIDTKKGERGKTVVEYNGYVTAEMAAKNTPVMNASEWRSLSSEIGYGFDFGENTNWFKEIEQTAISQVHNISLSGGNEKSTYRASINYRDINGVEIKTGYSQVNGRINLMQKALNGRLTLESNLSATTRESHLGFPQAFRYAAIYNPTSPVRSTDNAFERFGGYFQQVVFDYYNPVAILEQNVNEGKNQLLNFSARGIYNILPALSVDAFYSAQRVDALSGQYFSKMDYYIGMNRNGLASRSKDLSSNQLFETTIHYYTRIASSINLSALGGYSIQDFTNEGFYAQGGNFLTDAFTFNNLSAAKDFQDGKGTVSSYKNANKLVGFFSRFNFNINDKFYVTASARYDGSSQFGANKKWGLYPAFGAVMDLVKVFNVSSINNFKLRVNYGVTGNRPNESYLSLNRLQQQGSTWYNGSFIPGYAFGNNANPDLRAERKGEFDAGFDFSLSKSNLSGSIDFYTSTTRDLLLPYQIPPDYFLTWVNLGKLKNSGVDLTLNYNVISSSEMSYSVDLVSSWDFGTTIVSLSGDYKGAELSYGTQYIGDMGSPGGCCTSLIKVEEGKPVGQISAYVYKGIDTNGNIILEDADKNGYIDFYDNQVVGNGLPKFLLGFGNAFSYKNWDLNIFFRGVFGHDLINSFRKIYEVPRMITYYNLPRTAMNMKNSSTGIFLNSSSGIFSSYDVENASFLSLDNLSLGYNFKVPGGSNFSKIRIYLAGNNLFYITRYKGADPNPRYVDNEIYSGTYNNPLVPGVDRRDTWCRTRSFTLGANIVF